MNSHFVFHLKSTSSLEKALEELHFIRHLYCVEDAESGMTLLGGWSSNPLPYELNHVVFSHLAEDDIDWTAQWEQHAPSYRNGLVHIELLPPALELLLQPGAGFGDLSHPTTRLMLAIIPSYASNSSTIDIGCGSGVLSLAAIRYGAECAIGIDIDAAAIQHAQKNAELNHLSSRVLFTDTLTHPPSGPLLILMNMISSEQEVAWSACSILHDRPATIITSGIPLNERDHYLTCIAHRQWELCEERQEEEWLAFRFLTLNS